MRPIAAVPDRIRSKIGHPDERGCWPWVASLRDGYGQVRDGSSVRGAHLVIYERLVGAVPEGLDLDHLCRNRACVNPAHLEPVTRRTNLARSELTLVGRKFCKRGHAVAEVGGPCKACRALTRARWAETNRDRLRTYNRTKYLERKARQAQAA